MAHDFDPGYPERFSPLLRDHPGPEVYPPASFRVEWGPIFHRGRLDGSARVLVVGQDPAAHEAISRRILVGLAGQRVQGFLARLGISRSYVMVNTFLYSVYGQDGGEAHKDDPAIAAYRHRWLDELAASNDFEAIISFGQLAAAAVSLWRTTPAAQAAQAGKVTFVRLTHPTAAESAAKAGQGDAEAATRRLLAGWNRGLSTLSKVVTADRAKALVPYGTRFTRRDLTPIPEADFPAGVPAWMRSSEEWAWRHALLNKDGTKPEDVTPSEAKRAGIAVRIPKRQRIWLGP
jgi:uracil-DNA glycosylase